MCDTPYLLVKSGHKINGKGKIYTNDVNVPCGKCPPCKRRRVQDWVFRLMVEERNSSSSYFITLTYSPENLPRTPDGKRATLVKSDFQKFLKRLRKWDKNKNIKYYAVGEYGEKRERPHYHVILLNVKDINHVYKAWTLKEISLGNVHVGTVSGDSIAYTAKYLDKPKKIPKYKSDQRIPEFSLMSKGLGKSFLTPQMRRYYENDISRLRIHTFDGTIPLPRYYRKHIFTEEQIYAQTLYIQKEIQEQEKRDKIKFNQIYKNNKNYTYEQWQDNKRFGRYNKFYKDREARNQD